MPEVGVIVIGGAESAEDTLASVGEGATVVFVAGARAEDLSIAARAGADTIESPAGASTPGRARNAGYRRLKKQQPDVRYVQFVEAGARLAPGWLDAATKFLERRPEVAIIAGADEASPATASGEARSAGGTFLARAEAFETAGGYRGDLAVNETEDLCIRLRRRGAHVWRIDQPMAARAPASRGFKSWWRSAAADGYRFAHGARLHGAHPERLFVREHLASLFWGAALPLAILVLAVFAGFAVELKVRTLEPVLVAAGVVFLGGLIYAARFLFIAVAGLNARAPLTQLLAQALSRTFAPLPEFAGAWGFYVTPAPKRAKP